MSTAEDLARSQVTSARK